jgi:pyrimidine operon attenuation protein/uracil phosphoribosyltransferase
VVILTDDVGNTGKTLFYALQPLLTEAPKKIQVALLIDRRHKLFPIHADFVGLSLATTIQEHIEVVMNEAEESAYLQ